MDYIQLLYFLPTWCLIFFIPEAGASSKTVSACLSQTDKINLQCGYGTMIRITKKFYGYSNSNSCSYKSADCVIDDSENYPCAGKRTCTINLPSGGVGRMIPLCNLQSNYYQVEYDCIPSAQTENICTVGKMTAQSGYLVSPSYPNNYPDNQDCVAEIQLKPSQKVKLFIIDMDLESNRSQCFDWMKVGSNAHSTTLCGRRSNESVGISSDKLSIQFVTNNAVRHKGIWLYYEADPFIPTTTMPTPKPTTKSRAVTTATGKPTTMSNHQTVTQRSKTEKQELIPITRKHSASENEDKFPFAAIIGGVIGTLTFILIVLLILLAIKWWREKRSPHNKNYFIEVQNPAYRNSREIRNSTNCDNYYYYIDC